MIFHVLGLPHTKTNLDYTPCAFTMEIYDFCNEMTKQGHTVFHYGNEGSNVNCTKQINIFTKVEFTKLYGADYNKNREPYNITNSKAWMHFNVRVIEEIKKQVNDSTREFIICFWGADNVSVFRANLGIFVEAGIGYTGWFSKYKVFRSYFWQAFCMDGSDSFNKDGYMWDSVVIPSYFDPTAFSYSDQKEDYYGMICRLIPSKGIELVLKLVEQTGIKLKIAGQGDSKILDLKNHPTIEYVGVVDQTSRRQLLSNAMAVFSPTYYIEPFGRIVVESQMSGTPVITTDWGAFTETVVHGKTGFRCRTFQDFLEAIERIKELNAYDCRDFAINNFSIGKVSLMYFDYFEKLLDVYNGNGWYEVRDNRVVRPLDWLNKWYPV